MTLVEAAGTYFDGLTARAHPVTLRLGDRLEIVGRDVAASWDPADIVAADMPAPLMRLSRLGEPARVEFSDADFAGAVAARCPDLHRDLVAESGGRWRIALWSVAAGLSVLAVAVFGVPAVAVRLAPLVPSAIEARLGTAVDRQIVSLLNDPPACADPPGRAVLDRLVQRLSQGAALPDEVTVGVRRHAVANALTLPGGRIVILSDLIAQARSADEFAAVLAHELGHVAVRDPTRSLIQATGSSFLLSLVLGDLTGSTIVVALGQAALSAGYSRDAERAADAYAVAAMERAGGDGAALATILERIAKDDGKEDAASFLRSHPFTAERATLIRALAGPASSERRILTETDWQALKGICAGAARTPKP